MGKQGRSHTPRREGAATKESHTHSLSRSHLPSHLNGDAPQPQQLTTVPSWTLHDTGMLHGRPPPKWALPATRTTQATAARSPTSSSHPSATTSACTAVPRVAHHPPVAVWLCTSVRRPIGRAPRCTVPVADLQKRGPGIEYSKTAKLLFHEALRHLKLPLPPQICVSYPQSPNFHSAQSLDVVETALLRGRPSLRLFIPFNISDTVLAFFRFALRFSLFQSGRPSSSAVPPCSRHSTACYV
jgi:hypothetical protein